MLNRALDTSDFSDIDDVAKSTRKRRPPRDLESDSDTEDKSRQEAKSSKRRMKSRQPVPEFPVFPRTAGVSDSTQLLQDSAEFPMLEDRGEQMGSLHFGHKEGLSESTSDIRQRHREEVEGVEPDDEDGNEQIQAPQSSHKGQSASPDVKEHHCEGVAGVECEGQDGSEQVRAPHSSRKGQSASPDIRRRHRGGVERQGHQDGSEQIRVPHSSRKGQSASPDIRQLQCEDMEDTEDMEDIQDMESKLQQKRNKKTEVPRARGLCFKSIF